MQGVKELMPLRITRMKILSVSELNQYVARVLSQDFLLNSLRVEGEISGGKLYPSGHYYFTLKDSKAQISCVCFKSAMSNLDFKPIDGQHVIVAGYATIYEQGGRFQIIVRSIERGGEGLLYARFVELKIVCRKVVSLLRRGRRKFLFCRNELELLLLWREQLFAI